MTNEYSEPFIDPLSAQKTFSLFSPLTFLEKTVKLEPRCGTGKNALHVVLILKYTTGQATLMDYGDSVWDRLWWPERAFFHDRRQPGANLL